MPKALSSTPVCRVSSAAITLQACSVSRARGLKSPRLPIGVATTQRRPAPVFFTILRASMKGFEEHEGMGAILRRPRLGACLRLLPLCAVMTLSLIAACSLVKPVETPVDKQARARTLASEGKHADAAQAYAELAADIPADHDSYELLSAEQWVAAGNLPAAKQALAAVSAEARSKLPASRALVAAEIAMAEDEGGGAIHELDSIGVPTPSDLAQNYWFLRGEAQFLTGHPVEGTQAFIERERFLPDPAGLAASREELFNKIRNAAMHGQPLKVPPKADAVLAGWLQLAPVALELQRDPMHAAAALENWRRMFPQHPATDSVLVLARNQI